MYRNSCVLIAIALLSPQGCSADDPQDGGASSSETGTSASTSAALDDGDASTTSTESSSSDEGAEDSTAGGQVGACTPSCRSDADCCAFVPDPDNCGSGFLNIAVCNAEGTCEFPMCDDDDDCSFLAGSPSCVDFQGTPACLVTCTEDQQCADVFPDGIPRCEFGGFCTDGCETDVDCGAGATCVDGLCELEDFVECQDDTQCTDSPFGPTCIDGLCSCEGDDQCGSDFVCVAL